MMKQKKEPGKQSKNAPLGLPKAAVLLLGLLTLASACTSLNRDVKSAGVSRKDNHEPTSQKSGIPTDLKFVELVDDSHFLVADFQNLWSTEDSGRHWTHAFAAQVERKQIQCVSAIDAKTAFLVAGSELFATDDGGQTWYAKAQLPVGAKGLYLIKSCHFFDQFSGWLVGAVWQQAALTAPDLPLYVGAAFMTHDGGITWERKQIDIQNDYLIHGPRWALNEVSFVDRSRGWLVGDAGVILRTTDGGINWHLAQAPRVDYQRLSFLNDDFGWSTYKYGNGPWGVAITADGGANWRLLSESFVYGNWPSNAIFVTPNRGFAVSLKLQETFDGGRNWRVIPAADDNAKTAYQFVGRTKNGTLIAIGLTDNRITTLVSSDNGSTWHTP